MVSVDLANTRSTDLNNNSGSSAHTTKGPLKKVAVTFFNVGYSAKLKDGTTKHILNEVAGAVAPGEVLAIMG